MKKTKYTKKCYVHIITMTKKLDYLDGLLSIIFYEEYHTNRTNKWLFQILDFNKEHIIQPYNINISYIHEEEQFISCMTPAVFINGQYESRCYVNSFQVSFSSFSFRHLIMNIDFDKIIKELDDSEYELISNLIFF